MSPMIAAIAFLLIGYLFSASLKRRHDRNGDRKLPPGPTPLPIIGSLHLLRHLPHRVLQNMARTYGPVMSMRLGSIDTIIVSSAGAVEAFLKTHDAAFAGRPKTQAYEQLSYGGKGMVFTKYNAYWRNVRKLCTMQLLSASKTESFGHLRREELGFVVKSFKDENGKVVNVSRRVLEMIANATYRMIFGSSKVDDVDLKEVITEMFNMAGLLNIADFMPFLEPLDLRGLKRSMRKASRSFDKVMEKIIEERQQQMAASREQDREHHHKDFVDILLSQMNQPITSPNDGVLDQQAHILGPDHIKAILLDMVASSLDTSSTTIEWTMSELLRHPAAMKRLQQEIKDAIGSDRLVEEKDLPKFSYLDMVIKESLRLHPVGPFLNRQAPSDDNENIIINGYNIPKDSRIIINVWALGRDPDVWSENVEEFIPERFEVEQGMDFRNDYRFLPFGAGRRGCPGIHLGMTTVRLVVAQLVHCFNWELPHGMTPNDLDMTEESGSLTMPRAKNLLAVPNYRLNI